MTYTKSRHYIYVLPPFSDVAAIAKEIVNENNIPLFGVNITHRISDGTSNDYYLTVTISDGRTSTDTSIGGKPVSHGNTTILEAKK